MKLQLIDTRTMKLEIMSLDSIEPGVLYLIPKIVRCKKCDCIIQFTNGWQCPSCETKWEMADYASYFGMIQFDKTEPYVLRVLCNACNKQANMTDEIIHRIQVHGAVYIRSQKTIRYMDHLLDVIPPHEVPSNF